MCSLSPLPRLLEETVREEHRQFIANMKKQANVIAFLKVPKPVKTACKWTENERKRNNSLSMKRSREREAEEMRIISSEYDRVMKKQRVLMEQYRQTMLMEQYHQTPDTAVSVLEGLLADSQEVPSNQFMQSMQPVQIAQNEQSVGPCFEFGADDIFESSGELHHPQFDPVIHLLLLFQDYSPNPN